MNKISSQTGLIICYHNNSTPILKSDSLKSILLNSFSSDPKDRSIFDLYDDDGDNISKYNSIYAELTGLYYAWKNIDAPFYGLFHYRRLLDLSATFRHPIQNLPFTNWDDISQTHSFDLQHIAHLVDTHRLILPYRERIHDNLTVEGHYKTAHRGKDLDLLVRTAHEINPEFSHSLVETLQKQDAYYCTVFVCDKKLFLEFCEIIFPIFEAMLPFMDLESEELQPGHRHARVFGFMGERLLTAFVDYSQAKDPTLKPLHVSRTVLNFSKPQFTTSNLSHSRSSSPRVSVILPCYNVSEFLPHTFECLRAQTESSLEIIAINDESTDNTLEIIEKYALRDKRITSISHKNLGLGATRNVGLSVASGEYVHFFDPDDYILPTFYETMLHSASKHGADVVISTHCVVSPHTPAWDASQSHQAHLPSELRFGKNPTTAAESPAVFLAHTPVWDKLFKRDFLTRTGLSFVSLNAEDIPFTWQAYSLANIISFCHSPLYFYRNRPGSITGSYGIFKEVFEVVQITEDWLHEFGKLGQFKSHWRLKKFVSCAYGMYKIPTYLFTAPHDGYEFCCNLSRLVESIDPADIAQFSGHSLYKDWVTCFNRLKVGNIYENVVQEISRCTSVSVPEFIANRGNDGRRTDLSLASHAPFERSECTPTHELRFSTQQTLDLHSLVENHRSVRERLSSLISAHSN